jgi:hypothetical protein
MGTEFIASASADGQSQVEVTSGEVYVHIPWRDEAMRLLGGQALSTESDLQRVNVRMESGDGSDAFRLPSIESPLDFEKGSSVRGFSSGRLIGAQAPAAAVDVKQEADGRIVFDLGRSVSVTKINAYSWARTRIFDFDMKGAAQNFELYGSNTHRIPAANDPVDKDGWELIGRVDADSYFSQIGSPVKVGQQACSFTSATGCLGTYRYLMCVPLRRTSEPILAASKTCLGLLDVYSEPWTF